MPKYHYKAKTITGEDVYGLQLVETKESLARQLQQQELTVISISEVATGESQLKQTLATPIFEKKIKPFEMVLFVNQLATMLATGLPLVNALKSLADETENNRFRKIIKRLHQNIQQGHCFYDSLALFPDVFSPLLINLSRAGELSGNLDLILKYFAEHMEQTLKLKARVKSAVSYPIVVVSFSVLAIAGIIAKVVPIFQATYQQFGSDLPRPTQILLGISNIIREYFLIVMLLMIVSGIFFRLFINSEKGSCYFDKYKLRIPVFGILLKKAALARFARTLGVLIASGLPIIECFQIVAGVINNSYMELAVNKSLIEIQRGESITSALKKQNIFPPMLLQMMATGEEVGRLDKMLTKTAEFYEQQVMALADNLTTLLEPMLIIILGFIIGTLLVALFLPLFSLGKAALG